jgi:hypothetical protein
MSSSTFCDEKIENALVPKKPLGLTPKNVAEELQCSVPTARDLMRTGRIASTCFSEEGTRKTYRCTLAALQSFLSGK